MKLPCGIYNQNYDQDNALFRTGLQKFLLAAAIVFGMVDADFSDGCKLTIRRAQSRIFCSNWKEVLEKENIRTECRAIAENA